MEESCDLSLEYLRRCLSRYEPARLLDTQGMAHAAVAMIVREVNGEPEILMVRRAEHPGDPWSGHMAFPGGRVEVYDDSLVGAAVRETREEIGLSLDEVARRLGRISTIQARSHEGILPLCVHPFVWELQGQAMLALNAEIEETVWIPLGFFRNPKNRGTLSITDDSGERILPACRYHDRVVWGLSLKMLDELVFTVAGTGG